MIIERYSTLLRKEAQPCPKQTKAYSKQISKQGIWPDIKYDSNARAGWSPINHLERIRAMALILTNNSQASENDQTSLRRSITLALDHWCKERYQSANWWWNEIGTPRVMRDIYVLMQNELTDERRIAILEIINQHKMRGTGANLIWSAELSLHHGCLTANRQQIECASQSIWSEIQRGEAEGIQTDGSYYQHGERLQTFHYGKAYLSIVCSIAWQLRSTPWSIPDEKRRILTEYILTGPQWMCRGTFTSPGTLDRLVSRKDSLQDADIRACIQLWCEVDADRRDELESFINRQSGEIPSLTGYRHFPYGDFTTYHRPTASIFLKTISDRTHFTEAINHENQKGVPFLNCGDHYILKDGSEYHNLQPVWEWKHLPGITLAGEQLLQTQKPFTGGVGNGESGVTAMDYTRKEQSGSILSLRKSWFFHEDQVICLISDTELTNTQSETVSAVEQCAYKGPATIRVHSNKVIELDEGDKGFQDVQWILHNGIGYIPLNMAEVKVCIGNQEGSWQAINHQYSATPERAPVFKLLLKHKANSRSQGWMIVLDACPSKLDTAISDPNWQILRNDSGCQSIRFHNGPDMAAFYDSGEINTEKGLTVDGPCIALWTEEHLWLCDPTMVGKSLTVKWQQSTHSVELNQEGAALTLVSDTQKQR